MLVAVLLALSGAVAAEETEQLQWENRDDIPEAYRWNIADILPDEAAFDATVAEVEEMLPKLKAYQGRLSESPDVLADALDLFNEIQKTSEDALVWANQRQHTDTRDPAANATQAKSRALVGKVGEAASFLSPEIAQIPADTMRDLSRKPAVGDLPPPHRRHHAHRRSHPVVRGGTGPRGVVAAPGIAEPDLLQPHRCRHRLAEDHRRRRRRGDRHTVALLLLPVERRPQAPA